MDSQWILSAVRARSLRRVVTWTLVLLGVAFLLKGQRRYVQNFLRGPYHLGATELDAIRDVSETPQYFVEVVGSKTLETGLEEITVRKRHGIETGRSVTAAYYVLVVRDKLLVCKSKAASGTTFTGALEAMPADLAKRFFDDPDMQAIRDRFYPYYLNDDSFRLPGYFAIAGLLILVLLFVKIAIPAWTHLRDPSSHPLVKRVHDWGDPLLLAAAQREAGAPRFKARNGWSVTDQFLIRSAFFTFDLLRLSDLLWAYKKVTKHSVNFIPTGKTHEAILLCYGGTAMITGKEARIDEILTYAAARAPWALFGYEKGIETQFRRNQSAFCAAVEQRKRELAERAQQA